MATAVRSWQARRAIGSVIDGRCTPLVRGVGVCVLCVFVCVRVTGVNVVNEANLSYNNNLPLELLKRLFGYVCKQC